MASNTIIKFWPLHSNQIETSSPKGVKKNKNKGEKKEKSWLSPGIKPRATDFSHQCSNHWAMTTLYFQDLHIFSFILVSSTACCDLVLNRLPFMCRQNTFSVSTINTSPIDLNNWIVEYRNGVDHQGNMYVRPHTYI